MEFVLPSQAQAPGSYTEAEVDIHCKRWVSDCMGNAGMEGDDEDSLTLDIVSIDDTCVVGELVQTSLCSVGSGQFAVSRCP